MTKLSAKEKKIKAWARIFKGQILVSAVKEAPPYPMCIYYRKKGFNPPKMKYSEYIPCTITYRTPTESL